MDATVTVSAVESVGADTVAIEFESPENFEAAPGQFVKLTGTVDDEEYSRFYTLSSATVSETFEVTVAVDPEDSGPFSEYLANLEPGDAIEMAGPFGSDYYQGEERVVLIVGGPGIGPAVGIGQRALADGHEAAIVYKDDTPAHEGRLAELQRAGASVTVTDGDLTDPVGDVLTNEDGEQVFVYGFAEFIDEATEAIEAAGGTTETAKIENFG